MFKFLEGKYQPLAPLRIFYGRVAKAFFLTLGVIGFSLAFGASGYHYLGHLPWLDALLNASMILTGMGPVNPMETDEGKVFAIVYCLYSGIAFLSLVAILMAPIYHRFLHRFNLDRDGKPYLPTRAQHGPVTSLDM
jgi:hypothetical protein